MNPERTKVVATLGPASSTREVLGGMVDAGLDVVRLNFSHGERADHLARFELVRAVAAELGRNLAILVDLQGPKIRVGLGDDNGIKVDRGREVTLVAGADYVALSFVRKPDDVVQAKQAIADNAGDIPVVAKLERPEAIDCLDEILEVADAVMVARGDLGVELAVEKVPPIQKHIIARANSLGVPVITATQMLESMVASPRPTRAEASDVANAIFDGTDAVMLSQETAIGQYPVESVATMARIAREAEATPYLSAPPPPAVGKLDVPATVCRAAVQMATDLGARAIVAFTESGATARYVSRFRPRTPILGLTTSEAARRRMALFWGVETATPLGIGTQVRGMIDEADERVVREGLLAPGDLIVVVAGSPGGRGGTNRVLVHRVGSPDLAAREA
jgi:pyruvate kinase